MLVVTGIATLGGLAFILASLLVVADRRLRVDEDPRIDLVEEMLPHANCGACGFPGCRPFAEALVAGGALPGKCTVTSDAERTHIADFLGVDVGAEEKVVARLACAGGNNVARNRARYDGLPSCRAAAQVAGGGKGCFWGCLGFSDCEEACDFDAIRMDAHDLPVVDEVACTACGDCVDACPKDLFSLHPVSHRLWVACRSLEAGDQLVEDCEVDDDDREDIDTLGGLVFAIAGRIPARGEVLRHDTGLEFEVVEADPRHIKKLRVRPAAVADPTGDIAATKTSNSEE